MKARSQITGRQIQVTIHFFYKSKDAVNTKKKLKIETNLKELTKPYQDILPIMTPIKTYVYTC